VIPTVFVDQFWADFAGNADQDPWDMTNAPYDLGYFEQATSATAADDGGRLGDPRWVLTLTGLPGLEAKIIESQGILDEANEGGNIGEFPAGARTTFQTAIDAAQTVLDDGTTTNEQADAALNTLTSDLETFLASVVTGLNKELLTAGVKLFPNPALNSITINNLDRTSVNTVKVFNTSGKIMYEQDREILGELKINLSMFSAGLYIMKLSQANGKVSSLKFVKQ
ncbi:MAG: T9SS type A sorting domain-containing protein, partial [Bacteroidota bacterium]